MKLRKILTRAGWKINRGKRLLLGERSEKRLGGTWADKPPRWDLIQQLIDRYSYRHYLEIGCSKNTTFSRINCEHKVGVDPARGGTVRKTSDEFFAANTESFDCMFIDGLHTYEQAKRDIVNAVQILEEGGVILIHDSVPLTIEEHAVPREQGEWTGDVWKAIVEMRAQPDTDTAVCMIDRGIGIVLKRPNRDRLKLYEVKDYGRLRFGDYVDNFGRWMRPVEYKNVIQFIES